MGRRGRVSEPMRGRRRGRKGETNLGGDEVGDEGV
jgi:hypothetical protein